MTRARKNAHASNKMSRNRKAKLTYQTLTEINYVKGSTTGGSRLEAPAPKWHFGKARSIFSFFFFTIEIKRAKKMNESWVCQHLPFRSRFVLFLRLLSPTKPIARRKSVSQFKIAINTLANKWDAKLFPHFLVMWSPTLGNLQDRDVAHLFHAAERGLEWASLKYVSHHNQTSCNPSGTSFHSQIENRYPGLYHYFSVPSRNLPFEKAVRTKLESSGLRENKWYRYIILSSWFTRAYWWVRPNSRQVNWYQNFAGVFN